MTAIQRRVMALERKREAAAVSQWQALSDKLYGLHGAYFAPLPDAELKKLAAGDPGAKARHDAFMAQPAYRVDYRRYCDLEGWLVAHGYTFTVSDRGLIVVPGMARS